MMQTDINTAKGVVSQFVKNCIDTLKAKEKVVHAPIFLHSSPGIGKSAIVSQIAKDFELGFVDVRLAQMEQSDVAGIPYVSHAGLDTEDMKTSIPSWFPSKERIAAGEKEEFGILFLDELSNAPIGVQHAAYGIVLDRMVHGVKMGDGWLIIAAGNLKGDKTGAKGVAPALANRFGIHLEIVPNLDAFRNYAVKKRLNQQIIGFLSFKPDALYRFDPSKNDVSFATPRSWEQVAGLLDVGFSQSQLPLAIAGCVGESTSSEFMAFQKYYGKLPNFVKIMDGKEEYKVPKNDLGLVFAVASAVISCLVENSGDNNKIKNLQKIMDQLSDDLLVMIYKTMKHSADKKAMSNILIHTRDTYNRIVKYTKESDD